jgi:hypothetical protein
MATTHVSRFCLVHDEYEGGLSIVVDPFDLLPAEPIGLVAKRVVAKTTDSTEEGVKPMFARRRL